MPAKMTAKMTEMKVKIAEPVPRWESTRKVRGSEAIHEMMAVIKPIVTVWQAMAVVSPPIRVFTYLAPMRT